MKSRTARRIYIAVISLYASAMLSGCRGIGDRRSDSLDRCLKIAGQAQDLRILRRLRSD